MEVSNPRELGVFVRDRRRAAALSQADLASRARVSRRWLTDLESGKPTAEVGLVFRVISALGLYIDVLAAPEPALDPDAYLDAMTSHEPRADGAARRATGVIRPARPGDVEAMRRIEVAAGRVFADVGMQFVASDEALPAAELLEYVRDGRAWVAGEEPVAYLIARWVDGNVHIEQVSVDPAHAGRRIGAALVEHVAEWARARSAPALTLTTYTEVAWNGPYYERLGFRALADADLTEGLRRIRAEEAAHGLDQWPRQAMHREIPG
jgi:GNAT superfamily N-acetyltransferase/DNA-binding XRE family transcriptional regulator